MQARSQVSQSFSNIISSRQSNLQAQIAQDIEDSLRLLCFFAKQDTTKKGRVNDTQLDFEFEISNNEEYEVDGIWDSTVYAQKSIPG